MALAHSRGVTIATGTDIAGTGPGLPNSWGQNGAEPGYPVKLGMTLPEAIEAAAATARSALGRRRRTAACLARASTPT